jgi:hypothetical protein
VVLCVLVPATQQEVCVCEGGGGRSAPRHAPCSGGCRPCRLAANQATSSDKMQSGIRADHHQTQQSGWLGHSTSCVGVNRFLATKHPKQHDAKKEIDGPPLAFARSQAHPPPPSPVHLLCTFSGVSRQGEFKNTTTTIKKKKKAPPI